MPPYGDKFSPSPLRRAVMSLTGACDKGEVLIVVMTSKHAASKARFCPFSVLRAKARVDPWRGYHGLE